MDDMLNKVVLDLIAFELGTAIKRTHKEALFLAAFPRAMLQLRPENTSQMDVLVNILDKAQALVDACEAGQKLGEAMIERKAAVAETGKTAVSA